MDVAGHIEVLERTVEEFYLAEYLPIVANNGFTATFSGGASGMTFEMERDGATPDEAISNLKSAMTKAGVNWTLEE